MEKEASREPDLETLIRVLALTMRARGPLPTVGQALERALERSDERKVS